MFLQDVQEIEVIDLDSVNNTNLSKCWQYKQKLREQLWQRFRDEYLGQLKLHANRRKDYQIQVGEIVLVGNDSSKRLAWPLAQVKEVFPGQDGKVRLIRLKTSTGEMIRPLQRVYPLEIWSSELNKMVPKEECQAKDTSDKSLIQTGTSKVLTRTSRLVKLPARCIQDK